MADAAVLLAANSSWNLVNFRAPVIRGLQERGYTVLAAAPEDSAAPLLREMGVVLHHIAVDPRGLTPGRDLRLLLSYYSLLRRLRPDAFLGFTPKPNIYGSIAAALLHIPVINTITGLGSGFLYGRTLQTVMTLLYRVALRRSARVFFHNPDDRDVFMQKGIVSRAKAAVIPGSGVNLERFSPAAPGEPSEAPPLFLFIARMIEDKGTLEFIRAATMVRRLAPARFRMLGAVQDDPKAVPLEGMRPLLDESGIEVLSRVADVRPLIAESDCVVLPSYREGLPRVLLEASAMGKPVVSTNVAGCRHVVEHGVTGLLCEARSAESLAEAMIAILRMSAQDRSAMGTLGRRRMEHDFSEEVVVSAYVDALQEIRPKLRRSWR